MQAVPVQVDFNYTSGPELHYICTYQIRMAACSTCPTLQSDLTYFYFCDGPVDRDVPSIIQGSTCCKPQLPVPGQGPEGSLSYQPFETTGGVGGPCAGAAADVAGAAALAVRGHCP